MSTIATGLETAIADQKTYDHAVKRFRDAKIALPTFEQLAEPDKIPAKITNALSAIEPDAPHPLNLFRVHWWNDSTRRARAALPSTSCCPRASPAWTRPSSSRSATASR